MDVTVGRKETSQQQQSEKYNKPEEELLFRRGLRRSLFEERDWYAG